jgi:1-acyl-sn-glycerol-3-phosphate acyltransferase
MPTLRAAFIIAIFLLATLAGIPVQWVSLRLKLKLRRTYPHAYHRFLCKLFGIRITVIGKPVRDRGVLMVANHSGYFDILVMSATVPVSFVAKSEVAGWPFIGLMTRLQEGVFVERERRSQVSKSRDELRRRLRDGDALVLFPEGTSTDGNRVIAFKSALMGAAESEVGTGADGQVQHVPVQPVSISYVGLHGMPIGRENRPLVAWYGDMDLIPHVWEAVKAGPLDVVVEFHRPMSVDSAGNRKQIAALAEAAVRAGQRRALNGYGVRPAPEAKKTGPETLAETPGSLEFALPIADKNQP